MVFPLIVFKHEARMLKTQCFGHKASREQSRKLVTSVGLCIQTYRCPSQNFITHKFLLLRGGYRPWWRLLNHV